MGKWRRRLNVVVSRGHIDSLGKVKQFAGIDRRQLRHVFWRGVLRGRERIAGQADPRRLISFAAIRVWCQVGCVGLNQQPIARDRRRYGPKCFIAAKCEHTRKRDMHPQLHTGRRDVSVSAK